MPPKAKKRRIFASGLTLPGYNYLGPFNAEDNGEPTNASDRAAQTHDAVYKRLSRQYGYSKPYTHFNKADEAFIQEVSTGDYGGRLGKRFFQLKRIIAPRLQEDDRVTGKKHSREGASLPNLQSSAMSENKGTKLGSGNEQGTKETPIDDIYDVHRGPPNYTFASLPYHLDALVTDNNTWSRDIVFRMTSPYDPLVTTASGDLNVGGGTNSYYTPVADAGDATIRQANYYQFYSGLYKYYHTISCRYRIFIENYGEPLWVYTMYGNEETPPVTASNLDIQMWPGVKYYYLSSKYQGVDTSGMLTNDRNIPSKADVTQIEENDEQMDPTSTTPGDLNTYNTGVAVFTNPTGTATTTIMGSYQTGDFDREIRLDADVENWTAVNANPKLPERLIIRVKPNANRLETNSALNGGDDMRYRIRVTIEYLVEFKELDYKLRYPVVTQPVTVVLNDVQTPTS